MLADIVNIVNINHAFNWCMLEVIDKLTNWPVLPCWFVLPHATLPRSEIDGFSRCLLFLEVQNRRENRKNWSDPNSPIFKIPYKIFDIEFFSNGLSWVERGSFGLNNRIKIRNVSLFLHTKKSKFFWASFFFVGNKAISNCCCSCGSCSSDTISWAQRVKT